MRVQRQGHPGPRKAPLRSRRPGRPAPEPGGRETAERAGTPRNGPAGTPPAQPSGGRRFPRLGDLRVRTRLLAVIAIPLIVATVLGALRVTGSLDVASRYEQFHEVAQLARTGTTLVQQLQRERDVTIDPAARDAAGAGGLAGVRQQTSKLEQQFLAESAQLSQSGQLKTRLAAVKEAFAAFPQIRAEADRGASGSVTDTNYLGLVMSLLGIDNELDGQLAQSHSQGWGLYTLSLSTSMLSSERALMSQAADHGQLTPVQRASLMATVKIRDMAQREFTMTAPPGDRAAFTKITQAPASQTAEKALLQMLGAPQKLANGPALPATWYADFGTRVQALDKLAVDVSDRLVSESKAQYDDAMSQARLDAGVTAALLVAALGLAFAVSRSISQGLTRLHEAAVDVAEVRLPHLMHDLQDNPLAAVDLHVPPSGITTRDDIGDVAQAFDAVHREAVRLAGDQAQLRESVSTLFRNLSHRNQGLVQRQLSILTALEQHEDDAGQLKRLFELDHLAARMRRNSENLLVLAGGQSVSRASRPMSLLDVVRTAMSEVEQFERVGHLALPPVFVAGYAVGDVAHLLSELLENALMFSSPQTEVQVGAQQLPDGRTLVEIRDHGIGMDATRLERANTQFSTRETLTPDSSEHMGLYVVGLLARRHGIEVALRTAVPGTSALVILPRELAVRLPGQQDADGDTTRQLPQVRPTAAGSGAPGPAAATEPTTVADARGHAPQGPGPVAPDRPRPARDTGEPDFGQPSGWAASVLPPLPTLRTGEAAEGAGDPPAGPADLADTGATGATAAPGHVQEPVAGPDPAAAGGLPRRVPMALLKPGSVAPPEPYAPRPPEPHAAGPLGQEPAATAPAFAGAATAPPSPGASDRLRSRLGALHQGIARADDEDAPRPSEGGQE